MLKLDSVNKYFNYHKKNEIHVINNVSYSFPSNGLVAILGPSGSGKTTVLNAIGGLDKVQSGHIFVNGEEITKVRTNKLDEIRNLNIGYIFQDYKLIDNKTVFENVALSLKLIGIKDDEEIKKRVLYTLKSVGMERYKNRLANMLSGGERQRVGIARALVKNPKIILADEPTGNLDSKNSLEVMNIIKSISTKYLVILVTHEEKLARFYATDIIEFKDGGIVLAYQNTSNHSLDYEIDNYIYLKDYENIDRIKEDNVNINVYRNNKEEININIAIKNGSIYIENNSNEKMEVIDNNSSIKLIDDHYKEIDKKLITNDFDIESISDKHIKEKYSSIFKVFTFIPYGFKKVLNYPLLKKFLLGGFFLSGMFIMYAIATIFATLKINDQDFVNVNRNYLTSNINNIKVDDYLNFEKLNSVDYLIPGSSIVNFKFYYDKFIQSNNIFVNFTGSLASIDLINKDDLIMGRMPNNRYELVVDKMTIENVIMDNFTNEGGFSEVEDFLNHELYLDNLDKFVIVGITDLKDPSIYTSKDLFINILANSATDVEIYNDKSEPKYIDYELYKEQIKLVSGRLPINDYEIILNNNLNIYELNSLTDYKINNQKLKVVGYYENYINDGYNYLLVNNNTVKYNLISNANTLSIYSNNKEEVMKYFQDHNINIKDAYDYAKEIYLSSRKESIVTTLIVSGVILLVSLVEILLMIRASFLSRIKEVGIYRAIGVKKSDIYKMFMGEVIAVTIVSSIPGITLMAYILYSFRNISFIESLIMINIFTYLFSIILVFVFNLVVGLLPVYNTIKKTPAMILSRTDVD